jgi:hypothetical protein
MFSRALEIPERTGYNTYFYIEKFCIIINFYGILLADFFGALRARVYDDEVRKWVSATGVENLGKRLVNSREGPVTFDKPKMTLGTLMQYGFMLVQEQENVKRVQLADKYLSSAALGDANDDAIKQGTFLGKFYSFKIFTCNFHYHRSCVFSELPLKHIRK